MQRRPTQLNPAVKTRLENLKHQLDLKTESQVVAYLISMYDSIANELKLNDHKKYVKQSIEIHKQLTI